MDNKYYIVPKDELYHYGVLGMKWGIRRSRQSLSNRVDRLGIKNKKLTAKADKLDKQIIKYDTKSAKISGRNSRYEARLVKATAKKAKYDVKLNREQSKLRPNSEKVEKYAAKSAKYDLKIKKAQRKLKYNKWSVKSEAAKADAAKARAKIEKNANVMKVYNNTISAMDNGSIEQGRLFMKYVFDD